MLGTAAILPKIFGASKAKKIEAKHMKKVAHTHEEEVKKAQEFEHAMSRQQHGLVFIALLT